MTLGLGLGLTLLGNALGLLLLPWYGKNMALLLVLLSWLSLTGMISNTYGAVLQRRLVYKPIAIIQTLGTILSYGAAILAAYRNCGIWSLFFREAILTLFVAAGLAWTSTYCLQRKFNRQTAIWIWNFGWRVMGNRLEEVLFERLDKLVVGIFFGTATLGQYNVAYRLAWVGHQFSYGAIESVSFSVFSSVQKKLEKLHLAFEKLYYWLLRLALILGIFVWFCGADLVIVIYGPKWEQAGYVFRNMAVLLVLLPLETSLRSFLVGSGHINYSLKVRVWQLMFFIPAILAAAYWGGIIWVVWSINISILLSWFLAIRFTSRVIPVRWGYLMQKPATASLVTLICVEIIDEMSYLIVGGLSGIVLRGSLLGAIFVLSLYVMERHSLQAEWLMIRTGFASN
jgi:PST family polysaccharide transporter